MSLLAGPVYLVLLLATVADASSADVPTNLMVDGSESKHIAVSVPMSIEI